MPSVSVIVPVRNEARSIEQTLRSLLTQEFPRDDYEVIVADGCSTDGTVPIVRGLQDEFSNLKLVFNPGRFSSAGRNTAIRHATKDVAVIVDGHCHVPDRKYLRNVSEAFAKSGADSLGRPQPLEASSPTPFQQAVSVSRQSRLGHNPESDIFSDEAKFVPPQSTAVAYSRKVFHTIGLFDQAFDACEDVEFNQRVDAANLTCYFTPTVKVAYHPRGNFRGLFYQLARYGMGRARLSAKYPRSLTLPALVPPLWVLWVIVGGLLSLFVPYLGWLWAVSVALYVSVLFGAAVILSRGQPHGIGRRIPLVFLGIHCGFAWGFLKETARQAKHVASR
jgi:glycosyltransferase involved in cell wall biosynthesis